MALHNFFNTPFKCTRKACGAAWHGTATCYLCTSSTRTLTDVEMAAYLIGGLAAVDSGRRRIE